jgi:hypothetical protein
MYKDDIEDDVAFPCGLTAATKFNDTFSLTDPSGEPVKIDQDDIAWESDKDYKFENLGGKDTLKKQWTDIEDEHFIVWMRLAALPTFRKLWGRIEKDLDEGDSYKMTITNNYDVSEWDGEKHFVLTTANAFGGRNIFLGTLFLVAAGVCLLIDLVFIVMYVLKKPNMDNLKW